MKIRALATRGSRYLGTKKGKYYILNVEDSPWKSAYTGNVYGIARRVNVLGSENSLCTLGGDTESCGYTRNFIRVDSILNPNTKIL